jgi:hypothetical protein
LTETGLSPTDFAVAAKGLYAAAAVIEPARAVADYEKLPDESPHNPKGRVRDGLVGILSKHGDERWQTASDHLQMPMPWHKIQ